MEKIEDDCNNLQKLNLNNDFLSNLYGLSFMIEGEDFDLTQHRIILLKELVKKINAVLDEKS